MFAACAAAGIIVASCSSDETLAEVVQQEELAQEPSQPVIPLELLVSDGNATRGTVLADVSSLQLFSTRNGAATPWLSGETFVKSDGKWGPESEETDVDWSTKGGNAYDFYAINDANNVTEDGEGNKSYNFGVAEGRCFTYKVPTAWASQKDLLVGSALNLNKEQVDMKMIHGLAAIKEIKLNCRSAVEEGGYPGYFFRVNGIKLCGVSTTGTYTFPSTENTGTYKNEEDNIIKNKGRGTWLVDNTAKDTYEVPVTNSGLFYLESETVLPINGGEYGDRLYLLPQTITKDDSNVENNSGWHVTGPYVELDVLCFTDPMIDSDPGDSYDAENGFAIGRIGSTKALVEENWFTTSEEYLNGNDTNPAGAGYGKVWVPLTVTLLPNGTYRLNVDLSLGIYDPQFTATKPTDSGLVPVFDGFTPTLK